MREVDVRLCFEGDEKSEKMKKRIKARKDVRDLTFFSGKVHWVKGERNVSAM
jgi:hypothetical protein